MNFGSITTGIIADGLVFNMDAANRASTIPSTSTDKTFNTIDTSISGSFINDTFYDSSTISPSFAFDGVDDKISLSPSFDLDDFNSIGMWVNLDSNYNGVLIGESSYQYDYLIYMTTSEFWYRIYDSTAELHAGASYITANNWHYITTVRNNTEVSLYVDGIFRDSDTGLSSTWNTKFDTIGDKGGTTYPIEGNIANIHAYNRLLSANEILHNYNALKTRFGL